MTFARLLPIPVTVVLLGVLQWLVPVSVPAGPEVEASRLAIREALEATPYLAAGRLVAQDQPLPTEAMKMLKPNAVMSRNYRDVSRDRSYGFVMIHATDLNDMIGHYPPICYPSSGWLHGGGGGVHELSLDFATVPIREYRFVRRSETGADMEVRVLSGFVLPDGSATTDMTELRARAGRRALAAAGAAQFQMIVPASYDEDETLEAMTAILASTEPALRQLGLGQAQTDDDGEKEPVP